MHSVQIPARDCRCVVRSIRSIILVPTQDSTGVAQVGGQEEVPEDQTRGRRAAVLPMRMGLAGLDQKLDSSAVRFR